MNTVGRAGMRSSLRPHFMTQAASVASSSNKRIMQEAPPMVIDGHTRRNPGPAREAQGVLSLAQGEHPD